MPQMVLEQEEVVKLVKEALRVRGVSLPEETVVRLRKNNKKSTIRVVLTWDVEEET